MDFDFSKTNNQISHQNHQSSPKANKKEKKLKAKEFIQKASMAQSQGKHQMALEYFRQSVSLNPTIQALNSLGELLEKENEFQSAEEAYAESFRLLTQTSKKISSTAQQNVNQQVAAMFKLLFAKRSQNKYNEALEFISSTCINFIQNLGEAYKSKFLPMLETLKDEIIKEQISARKGNEQDAYDYENQKEKKEKAMSFIREGNEMQQNGRLEEAIALYTKSLTILDIPDVYFQRGNIFIEMKDFPKAIDDFNSFISKANAQYTQKQKVQIILARCYEKMSDYEKALNTCNMVEAGIKKLDDPAILASMNETIEISKKLIELKNEVVGKYRKREFRTKEAIGEEVFKIHGFLTKAENSPVYDGMYCLVSMNWFKKWKKYVHYDKESLNQLQKDLSSSELSELEKKELMNKSTPEINWNEYPGPISNEDLLDLREKYKDDDPTKAYTNLIVNGTSQENEDFIIVTNEHWLEWERIYGGKKICRYSQPLSDKSNEFTVEVRLLEINIIFIPSPNRNLFQKKAPLFISKKETVTDLKDKIRRIVSKYVSYAYHVEINLIKLSPEENEEEILHQYIASFSSKTSSISIKAEMLQSHQILEELAIAPEDVIIVELIQPNKPSSFKLKSIRPTKDLESSQIIQIDQSLIKNVAQLDFLKNSINDILKGCRNGRKGLTGIYNIGNTCFMNSSLQCLSNAVELTKYFLLDLYKAEINKKNPLGTGGILAMHYGDFMHNMWKGNSMAINAIEIKKAILKITHQFAGYGQQDSQEFLNFVLDGLHEDLNRIKDKPYREEKDLNKPDAVLSLIRWNEFLERNQSVVVDLFYGQLKSKITCPSCKKISITFDPFAVLNLPIPYFQTIELNLVYEDMAKDPLKLEIKMAETATLQDLEEKIKQELEIPNNKFTFALVNKNYITRFINQHEKCVDAKNMAGDLFAYEYKIKSKESLNIYKSIEIRMKQFAPSYLGSNLTSFSFPRVLMIKKSKTITQLKVKIFKMFRAFIQQPNSFSHDQEIEEDKSNVKQIVKDYQYYFGDKKAKTTLYDLKLFNNIPKEGGFFSSKKSNCKVCNTYHKNDCDFKFPDEDDLLIADICMSLFDQKREFVLIMEWAEKPLANINQMKSKSKAFTKRMLYSKYEKKHITLSDCLSAFSNEEQLDKDNKWFCPKCKDHQQAFKKMDIFRLPRILVLNLKRFKHRVSYGMMNHRKLTDFVEYPMEKLDLAEYVKGPKNLNPCLKYNLFAVSNHMGGLSGGHYTASCFNPIEKKWVYFDDSHLSAADHDEIVSKDAYTLFYRRQDMIELL